MIGYLEGKLIKKEEERILLLVNHVGYEILLPAIVMKNISLNKTDDTISLFIYYYQTERNPKPVLIGFNKEAEKEFFLNFISVEAIGPMKAVKAMEIPVREMARAIEERDAGKLTKLKGIGKRTAQKIIATLEGKVSKFALIVPEDKIRVEKPVEDFSTQVYDVLVGQLGHKALDARKLISEALKRNPSISSPEELFDEVYKSEINR